MGKKRKTASKKQSKPANPARHGRFVRYCLVLLLTGVVALAWLSLLSFHPTDPPSDLLSPPKHPVDNRAGLVGAYVAFGLRYWIGYGAYAVLALLSAWAGILLIGRKITDLPWRLIGLVVLVTSTSAALYMANTSYVGPLVEAPGGIVGTAAGRFLHTKFGFTGGGLIAAVAVATGLLLAADDLLKAGLVLLRRLWRGRAKMSEAVGAFRARRQEAAERKRRDRQAAQARAKAPGVVAHPAQPQPKPAPKPADAARPDRSKPQAQPETKPAKKKPISTAPRKKQAEARADLPGMDLLAEPEGGYIEAAESQAVQRKEVLQQTLDDFGVDANVVGYMTGPVITLFEVSLSPGVKVSAVSNLATDIARSLAVPGVRIVPPRFGKDTVGIEVPNLDKEIVRLKELMSLKGEAEKKMRLPLYLGKDAGGDAIVVDLATMPHMLIAGTTGSGKSVCINTIVMSLLMTRTPTDVRFILVDPKMVEMAAFEKLPHLLCPTIHEMKKAEDILEWATTKMDERYEVLREAGVKNIDAFNRLKPEELYERFGVEDEEDKARVPLKLPSYVIIIDELADLMMTSSKEVESHIIRIAQKARAVGIHLVLATQRPSANVVTGLIKSNMPCRVSFRVASGQESRIVLDSKGAEVLLGQGDMLLLQPGDSNLIRAQGTYVDDSEIREVSKFLQAHGEQHFDNELLDIQSGSAGELSMEKDELFDQAVEVVLASKRGSVSLLQRRLQIGYGRASRIIDQMADAGILGEHKGSQARQCLISLEDWQALKSCAEADQSGANSLNGEPTSV